MNFYQPSLSVYDILDALSNKAATNRQNGYQNRVQHRHKPVTHQTYCSNHHRPRSVYYGFRPRSYFPYNNGYYQPLYYEEEEEEDPSTLHPRYQKLDRQPTDLFEILNALSNSSYGDQEVPEETQDEVPAEEKQTLTVNSEPLTQKEDISDFDKVDGLTKEDSTVQESTKSTEKLDIESKVNMEEPDSSVSASHTEIPSPIPEPLQVSKPEIRLDLPFSPEVNVYDSPQQYVVVFSLPGANSKSFNIDYHPSSHELILKGKIVNTIDVDEKYLGISELRYGMFERSIKFPVLPRLKDEEIKATYSNGLLQIKVPKWLDDSFKPKPKRRILIEDVPDEELLFEQNPNPQT